MVCPQVSSWLRLEGNYASAHGASWCLHWLRGCCCRGAAPAALARTSTAPCCWLADVVRCCCLLPCRWVHVGHFAEGPDEVPVAIEQKTQVGWEGACM